MTTKLFRNKLLRKTLSTWCAFATLATTTSPVFAVTAVLNSELNDKSANVNDIAIDGTTATFSLNSGSVGVLDWNSYTLNAGDVFDYKGADATWWNLVNASAGKSVIDGTINGQGNVFVLNPNGFAFGAGSVVNVGGIFAAAAMGMMPDDVSDFVGASDPSAFDLTGKFVTGTGDITVDAAASITAGDITLAGNGVTLEGTANGPVTIMSGNALVVDSIGGGNVSVTFDLGESAAGDVSLMGTFTDNLTAKAAGTVTVKDDITASGKNVSLTGVNWFQTAGKKITADKVSIETKNDVALDKVEATTSLKVTTAGAITQNASSGITTALVDLEATGDVTLDDAANAITAVKGSANDLTIVNTLSTTTVSDDLTVNSLTAGSITQDGGVLTATTITSDVTQNGGTITSTGDLTVNGDVTQTDGTIAAAATKKVTFTGTVAQNEADEKTAVIGAETAEDRGDVVFNGVLTQNKGTIYAKGLAVGAAGSTMKGTADAETITGIDKLTIDGDATLALTEVDDNFVKEGDYTLKVKTVGDSFSMTAGTLEAKDASGITFGDGYSQTGGKVESTSVTFDGDATQTAGAVVADSLVLNDATEASAVTLSSTDNEIKEVGGKAGSLTLVTKTDLAVGAGGLETAGDASLTAKDGTTAKDITFNGDVTVGAGGTPGTLYLDGRDVTQAASTVVTAAVLDLPADDVTLTGTGNEISKITGSAKNVSLNTKVDITVENLAVSTGDGEGLMKIRANDGTNGKDITLSNTGSNVNSARTIELDGSSVKQTGGTVKAETIDTTSGYELVGGDLKALATTSDLTVKGDITQSNGNINDMDTLKVTGTFTQENGTATLAAIDGNVVQDVTAGGTANIIGKGTPKAITFKNGNVTQDFSGSAPGTAKVQGNIVLSNAGTVDLQSTANAVDSLSGTASDVNLYTSTAIDLGALKLVNLELAANNGTAAQDVTQSGVLEAGTVKITDADSVTLGKDNVIGKADITVAKDLTLNQDSDVDLKVKPGTGTTTVTVKAPTTENITVESVGNLTLASVAAKDVTLNGSGDITVSTSLTANNDATVTAAGNVAVSGATVTGETKLKSTGATSTVTLSGNNTFNDTVTLTANGTVSQAAGTTKAKEIVTDDYQLAGDLESLTGTGDVTVKGNLTQTGGNVQNIGTLTVTDTLTQNNGSVNVTTIKGDVTQTKGTITASTIDGNVVQDVTGAATDAATIVGNGGTGSDTITFRNGNVSQDFSGTTPGTAKVQGKVALTDAGTVDLQSTANAIDALSGNALSAEVTTSGAIDVNTLTIENNLDVAAGGNVTLSGIDKVGGTAKLGTTSGTISQVAGSKVQANVIEADYTVAGGSLESLTGSGDVTVKGNLNQNGGAVQNINTLKVTGTLTQTDGSVTASTIEGNVDQQAGATAAPTIGTASTTTTFKNGNVSQTGANVNNGKVSGQIVLTNAGTVDLQSTKNDITTMGGSASSVNFYTTEDVAFGLFNIVNGLTVNAKDGAKSVSQTGVITAGSLTVADANDVTLNLANKIGSANIKAATLNLNQDSDVNLTANVSGAATVTVTDDATEDITINSANAITLTKVDAKDVTIVGGNAVTVNELTAKDNASVTGVGNVDVKDAAVTGSASLKSTAGSVSLTKSTLANNSVGNGLAVDAKMTATVSDTAVSGGNVSIKADPTASTATAALTNLKVTNGNLDVDAGSDVTIAGTDNEFHGNAKFASANGTVTQTGGTVKANVIETDTYNMAAAATSLESLTGTGDVTVKGNLVQGGGAVQNINNLTVTDTFTQNNGTLMLKTGAGAGMLKAAVVQNETGSNSSAIDATAIEGSVTQNGGDITAASIAGNVTQNNVGTANIIGKGTPKAITFKNGDVVQNTTGSGTAKVDAEVTLDNAGTVDLQSSANDVAKLGGNATTVKLATISDLELQNLTVTDLSLKANDTVTPTGMKNVTQAGGTKLTLGNLSIKQAKDVTLENNNNKIGNTEVTAASLKLKQDNDINLTADISGTAGNRVKVQDSATESVTINSDAGSGNDLVLDEVTGKNVTIDGDKDVIISALNAGGIVGTTKVGGEVSVTGAGDVSVKDLTAYDSVILKSTGGSVGLTKGTSLANNALDKSLKVEAATTATVEDTVIAAGGAKVDAGTTATIDDVNVKAGNLDVNAVGNITLADAVKVDAGATTIRTTTGNVTQTGTAGLTFVGGDASIMADAGSITITKATVGGTGKADSLTLTGKNNVSLANATVEKDLTAKSTDKDVALDTVTVKGNAVVDADDNVTLDGAINVDGTADITAKTGSITQNAGSTLTVVGNADVTATAGAVTLEQGVTVGKTGTASDLTVTGAGAVSVKDADVEGAVTLKSTGGAVTLAKKTAGNTIEKGLTVDAATAATVEETVVAAGGAKVDAGTTATIDDVNVKAGNLDVNAGGNITLADAVKVDAGATTIRTTTGNVTQTGTAGLTFVGGDASIMADAGSITITKATVGGTGKADSLTLTGKNNVSLANATVEKDLTAKSTDKDVALDTVTVKGNAVVDADDNVTLDGAINVDGTADITAKTGSITQNAGSLKTIGDTTIAADAGAVTIIKADVGDSSVSPAVVSDLKVTGKNSVSVSDTTVTGDVTLKSTDKGVTFNATAPAKPNTVGGNLVVDAKDTTAGSVALEDVEVKGDATVDAGKDVTLDGTIKVDGATAIATAAGDVTQQSGSLKAIGDTTIAADAGAVTIIKADVGDSSVSPAVVSDLKVTGKNAVSVSDTTVTGNATLKSTDKGVTFNATVPAKPNTVGGNLVVEAEDTTNGDATLTTVNVTGDADVVAGRDAILNTVVVGDASAAPVVESTLNVDAGRDASLTGVTAVGDAYVLAGVNVTLDNVTVGDATTSTVSDLGVIAQTGDVTLNNAVAVTGDADMEASLGNISQTAGAGNVLTVGGDATFTADTTDTTPAGTITLVGAGANDIDGKLVAEAGAGITITSNDGAGDTALQVSKIRSEAGNITVQATAITMDAVTGNITTEDQSGTTASTISLTATGTNTGIDGDIVLTKVVAGNDDGTVNLVAAKDVEMYADGRTINEVRGDTLNIKAGGDVGAASATTGDLLTHVNNDSLDVGGNVTAENDQSLNFSASPTAAGGTDTVGGALTQTVLGGNITQSATVAVDVTGVTTLVATDDGTGTSGHIILEEAANDFRSTVNLDTDDYVQIVDANNLKFDQVDVDGFLEAKSVAANIDQVPGTSKVEVDGTTHLEAATGITLDNAINDFVGAVSAANTTSGNISLRDANDIQLGDGGYTATAREDGVVNNGGDIVVATVDGDITLNNIGTATSGAGVNYSVDGANVMLTANGTAGKGNIVQPNQTIDVDLDGVAQTPAEAGLNTSVKASSDLVMLADGSVGNGEYITVEAGTVAVDAGSDASVVGIGGMDVKKTGAQTITYADTTPGMTSETYDLVGISTGGNADLYTDGQISTKASGGKLDIGGDVTVAAKSYDRTIDMTMNGDTITVNGIHGGGDANAPLDLQGGNTHPEVTASRNGINVFIDGRYVGGERKNFNRIWTLEAFQVLMPSIDVNYTVDDEGTITETTEGEE